MKPAHKKIAAKLKDPKRLEKIKSARRQQLRAAEEIARDGWNERGAVLGMGDYFAEEFLLEQEKKGTA